MDVAGVRRDLVAMLAEWKRLLRSQPAQGHPILRTLLKGPIRIEAASSSPARTCCGRRYESSTTLRFSNGVLIRCG